MTTSLVTGGAGFIGSHLVEALVARGDRVLVYDDLSAGRLDNLAAVSSQVEFVRGDIRDAGSLRHAMTGVQLVFHLAAQSSVSQSVEDPLTTHEVNATGTLLVLLAAREARAERVIYASSAAVYGPPSSLPLLEDMPMNPQSPYAVSKLAGETYCRAFTGLYGLSTVSLRFFNVFGPRQDPDSPYASVVPAFVDCLRSGRTATLYGSGEQTRDFVSVVSVVSACLQASNRAGIDGEVFNIGGGEPTTLRALIKILEDLAGTPLATHHAPERRGDLLHSWCSVEKAKTRLGFAPGPLRAGLADVLRSTKPGGT